MGNWKEAPVCQERVFSVIPVETTKLCARLGFTILVTTESIKIQVISLMHLPVHGSLKFLCLFLRLMYVFKTCIFLCFSSPTQNLNKQAYDLAKALLKRTAQAIEPYITNVSEDCKQIQKSMHFLTAILEREWIAYGKIGL